MMQTATLTSNAKLIGVVQNKSLIDLPMMLHKLSAGCPTTSTYEFDTIDLNSMCLVHPAATLMYKAGGDSMQDAGINDDDFLIVDTQLEAKHGQIIAASYYNETLVKQLHIADDRITLIAYNDDYDDVVIESTEFFSIIGVVTWTFSNKLNFR